MDQIGVRPQLITTEEMVVKVKELVERLRSENIRVSRAYLYGSYATGAAHADSDIDVAIVSPDLTGDRLQDMLRLTLIATELDVRFEVIGFRPEQFCDEHPLVWEIKSNGILIDASTS